MENSDILEKKFTQEANKFKIDIEGWNRFQADISNELNEKMQEIISLKNNINDNPSDNKSNSSEDEIRNRNNLKLKIDELKYTYESKLLQIKNMKNKLQQEKWIFESQSNDLRSKIKKERNEIEKMQIEIEKKNKTIKNKNIELDRKEKLLNEENDKYNHIQNYIKEQNNKNLKDEKDLEIAEYKKNIFQNEILDKTVEIENIKNKLNQEIKNLEEDKFEIFNYKNDIEQLNREINLRKRCLDDLSNNNLINEFNNIKNEIHMKEQKEEIDSKFLNTIIQKDINNNKIGKFDRFKNQSFNSELYLLKLKNRIDTNRIKLNDKYDTANKKFNHEKEQEYLMKSFENLNKIKK